ncbi:MAG: T9SS type A sorting domain-containing protein, partial [Cyclobacteriaceae bacterium]|nr:T9SS type A sorting domain-containing protein [Cyclobacteriaceae bacterium]
SIIKRWRNIAFPVTGVTHAALGLSLTLKNKSLAYYTEATPGNVEQGFSYVNSGTLPDGKGFSAWMYDSGPITISVRGPLLKQDKSSYNYNVTYNNNGPLPSDVGWNFVPNPYASPIDWESASGWVKTNVNAVASVWDEEGSAYRLTNIDGSVIAQGQGFWVQTNGAPLLTSTGATKVIDPNPGFYRKAFEEETSRLLVTLNSEKYYDVALVQFKKGASAEFDNEFDAYKMKNPIFNITTITNGGAKLASNVLPKSACTSNVKIDITNIDPGTYSLNFEGIESFNDVNSISLVDFFTQKTQAIEKGKVYTFEVTSDEKSYGSERFQLVFDFTDQKTIPVIVKEDNRLISNYEDGNQWYLNETLIAGATGKRFTPTVRGSYSVVVQDDVCELRSEALIVNEGLSRIFPNPASEFLKVDVYNLLSDGLSGNILLHSIRGQLVKDEKFTSRDNLIEIDIKELSPGTYVLTIVSDNGVIHEKSKVVIK